MRFSETWLNEAGRIPGKSPESTIPTLGNLAPEQDRDGNCVLTVPSTDGGDGYEVVVNTSAPLESTCSCPNFRHTRQRNGQWCKHLWAVARSLSGVAGLGDGSPTASAAPAVDQAADPAESPATGSSVDPARRRTPRNRDGSDGKRFGAQKTPGTAHPGAGRPSAGRPGPRKTPPELPVTLPTCDPVHRLGAAGKLSTQRKQHRRLLRTGAFWCASPPETGAAMDIREAVVRFRLLGKEDWAASALMWCALREPVTEETKKALAGLAATLGRVHRRAVQDRLAADDRGHRS